MKTFAGLIASLVVLSTSFSTAYSQATNNFAPVSKQNEELERGRGGAGDPGGGGVVKREGTLQTLAEAGIFFNRVATVFPEEQYPQYYKFSEAIRNEIAEIQKWIPVSLPIIPDRASFFKQKQLNEADYNKIANDYSNVIKSYGHNLDPASLLFVAFSKDNKTFLLPTFDDLKPRQQALIMYHEYFMRTKIELPVERRLELILRFDSYLYKILSGDQSVYYDYLKTLVEMNLITHLDIKKLYFVKLIRESKTPLFLGNLAIDGAKNLRQTGTMTIDPSLLQEFKEIPGLLHILKNSVIKGTIEIQPRYQSTEEVTSILKKVKPFFPETNIKNFYDRLKKYTLDHRNAFTTAPDSKDYIIYYDETENLIAAVRAIGYFPEYIHVIHIAE